MTKDYQNTIRLEPRSRGFHLITDIVQSKLDEMPTLGAGILHVHILHTSAGLMINENASPDVPLDFRTFLDRTVPDGAPYFRHQDEGPDDMPAHIKAAIVGSSATVPVANGRLQLGTWQGIYLCEFRDRARSRKLVLTLVG